MRKRKAKIYEGQYFKTIAQCVSYILLCAFLYVFLPDNKIRDILSIACIPLFTAMLIHGMGRIQNSSHAFLDIRILENCQCLDNNSTIWYTEETASDNIVVEIHNNGECTISTTDIVINPTTPKKDTLYSILYPVKPGESLYAVLPQKIESLKKVYLQYYSNRVDKALSFEGNLTIQEQAVFNSKKYMFESISPVKNYFISKIKKQTVMKRQIVDTFKKQNEG